MDGNNLYGPEKIKPLIENQPEAFHNLVEARGFEPLSGNVQHQDSYMLSRVY